jgi:hypothetical protein
MNIHAHDHLIVCSTVSYGEIAYLDNLLDKSLVSGDTSLLQWRNALTNPSEEDELLSLGLVVTPSNLEVTVDTLIFLQVLDQARQATGALAEESQVVVIGVVKENPS